MTNNEKIIKDTIVKIVDKGENFTFSQLCNEIIKDGGDPVGDFDLSEYLSELEDLEVLKYSKKFNEFSILEL